MTDDNTQPGGVVSEAEALVLSALESVRALEPGTDAGETGLWHILLNCIEYAQGHGIDFDAVLRQVREDYEEATGKPPPPGPA